MRNTKGQYIKQYTTEELKTRATEYYKKWVQTDTGRKSSASAQKRYRQRRRAWLHEYKKGLSCVYCGESNPLCIDLDHIDRSSKKGILATMITGGYSWDAVIEEVSKCQPVCANCHRIKSIVESGKMNDLIIDEYIPRSMLHLCSNTITEDDCVEPT